MKNILILIQLTSHVISQTEQQPQEEVQSNNYFEKIGNCMKTWNFRVKLDDYQVHWFMVSAKLEHVQFWNFYAFILVLNIFTRFNLEGLLNRC